MVGPRCSGCAEISRDFLLSTARANSPRCCNALLLLVLQPAQIGSTVSARTSAYRVRDTGRGFSPATGMAGPGDDELRHVLEYNEPGSANACSAGSASTFAL